MKKRDYYEILGIQKTANKQEIKRAYRRLAIKFHPDRNQGNKNSESKFKEIKEAYEVLSDPQKKENYDQYGHSAFEQNNMGNGNTEFSDIFGDVFGDLFGNERKQRNKGSDLQYNLELSLEEAIKGIKKQIKIPKSTICNICNGKKSQPNTQKIVCYTCKGRGQIYMRQGFFSVQQTCPKCQGEGEIIKYPCTRCKGTGNIKFIKTLSINIPSGIDNGDKIRLSGEGEKKETNTIAGDLYVKITIKDHQIFTRKQNNLYCEIPINFSIACLGGKIEIPYLNSKIKLKITPETQTGKLFRIKGKGIKSIRSNIYGDLLCKIFVETPVNLNIKQKNLLSKLQKSFNNVNQYNYNNPKSNYFINEAKKFFNKLNKKNK